MFSFLRTNIIFTGILILSTCSTLWTQEKKAEFAVQGTLPVHVQKRGTCSNSYVTFTQTHHGHVAFLGGSITEMNGYRPMICDWLKTRFPGTKFEFTDAGISSTCSTTGAFRLDRDVLKTGSIDLLFVEFAVNDDQDAGHSVRDSIRGMEGIVRHLWKTYPNADIVMTFFVNEPIMAAYRQKSAARSIQAHRKVAEHYGISTVDLAREITKQIDDGTLTWSQYGGVHPSPRGNRIAAGMIEKLLENLWLEIDLKTAKIEGHQLPDPIDVKNYENGRFAKFKRVNIDSGFTIGIPDWKNIRGECRSRYSTTEMLFADKPGSACSFEFDGTAIGAFLLAGPDAGIVEYRIDGGEVRKIDLFHAYSINLHYPRTVMFEADLAPGRHRIDLLISGDKNEKSTGHAVRILAWTLN